MKLSKNFGLLILTALLTSLTLLFWNYIPLPPIALLLGLESVCLLGLKQRKKEPTP